MPRGDRSGPEGRGPLTGRGLGYCAGNERPGYQMDTAVPWRGSGWGLGRGRRFGRGYGYGHGFGRRPDFPVESETASSLAEEIARLKDQLQALEERLAGSQDSD